ncbi:polygalacturonase-like [Silene latifolia]|uniref:polygalacturonase-like n=1 Tax=Silene latifolia TaxID=37657 RepID=UPI003D77708E
MTNNLFYLLLFSSLLHSLPSSASRVNPTVSSIKIYDVVRNFGAKGDGNTDATTSFLNAWKAACASLTPSQIYVPKGNYVLGSISFEGFSCKSPILFIIDGTLIARNIDSKEFWIGFHNVNGLRIKGGVLDAKGKNLWDCKLGGRKCPMGAKSLNFDDSKNIVIDGLTSRDSQLFHISINACLNVNMGGILVTAPATSPNTDGIHIERSNGVTIMHSQFMTGDDCISIGPFNQNLWIENVNCGPGHGISIGSLGKGQGDQGLLVQNVTVKTVNLTSTQNGLRIKTFASPIKGNVRDIHFLGATMTNVGNPIIIDQYYCPHGTCPPGQGSAIQISNVEYKNIQGISSTPQIVTFDCSPQKQCDGLQLQDIKLTYTGPGAPHCEVKNAHWKVGGLIQLPPKCLN